MAHNPAAVQALFEELGRPENGRQYAVFACMKDKDIEAMVAAATDSVDGWFVTSFDDPRALGVREAAAIVRAQRSDGIMGEDSSVPGSLDAVVDQASHGDRVVVFGSFRTVAEAMEHDI